MRGKASLAETLPGPGEVAVADGAICAQIVRCGKPNCKCARGAALPLLLLLHAGQVRPAA